MSERAPVLLRVERNTTDLDRAVAFYRDALGFEMVAQEPLPRNRAGSTAVRPQPPRRVLLALGAQRLGLAEFPDATAYPATATSCDTCFQHCAIVVSDMQAAHRQVMAHGAVAITQGGPQRLPPSTGSVTAFKFRDPDSHPLELIAFPPGTGDPRWQTATTKGPTLGIDHSAISVADIARSIAFYERLGLHVAARGVNRGSEQQRLDDLPGVEVDVVALAGATPTPHLELLGYRHPRGRVAPPDDPTAVAADRLAWQDGAARMSGEAGFDAGHVTAGRDHDATTSLLRDPDGHWLELQGLP